MSDKQLKALGAVLVVLVALIALARWNASRPATTTAPPVDLKTLTDSGVDKIVLSSAEGSVTLTKSSLGWSAGESAADTSTVTKFFKTLEGAKWNEIVSSNPENQSTFGTTGPTAKSLTFYEGSRKKAELIIGNPAADSPGSYYVKPGGKDVWSVAGDFGSIPMQASAWPAKAPSRPQAK